MPLPRVGPGLSNETDVRHLTTTSRALAPASEGSPAVVT